MAAAVESTDRESIIASAREWDTFEGLHPMPDGRVARFWIRDLPPALVEEVVAHMHRHYLPEEQMASSGRLLDDPQSKGEFEAMWRDVICNQRVSLAAFTDWPKGDGVLRIAGLNMLGIVKKEDPPMMMNGKCTRPMFVLMNEMLEAADIFQRYGVDSYLVGLGLSVAPQFRGQGLGLRLLRAREPLCAALRIPLTVTAFSGAQSQKQARRAGFEVLQTRKYADFVMDDGSRPFSATTWPVIEIQALFYGSAKDHHHKENVRSEKN